MRFLHNVVFHGRERRGSHEGCVLHEEFYFTLYQGQISLEIQSRSWHPRDFVPLRKANPDLLVTVTC